MTRDPPLVCVREREREIYIYIHIYICLHVDMCLYISTLIYERVDFDCIVRVVGVHYVGESFQHPISTRNPEP